jgi:hypothetical protein
MPLSAVSPDLLESLAAQAPAQAVPNTRQQGQSHGQPLDVDAFIARHGLEVNGPDPYQGGLRWTFRKSPMCEHDDDGPFLIQFENGALSAGCLHESCSWGWAELRARFEPIGPLRVYTPDANTLPEVLLPGGEQTISATGSRLGELLAPRQTHFLRGGCVTRVAEDFILHSVSPAEAASDFETVAQPVKRFTLNNNAVAVSATCTENMAKLILASEAFKRELPPLKLISRCPVLLERDGRLVVVCGYDIESGILARGEPPEELTLDDAVEQLTDIQDDFLFATAGDLSRAMAAMITPALVQGDLLSGRAAIDLSEADQSQAGKGYRNKLTAAIYGCKTYAVTMRRRGVGGLEENFDKALISGKSFISLDNIRGHVDLPALESFCTEDSYSARTAYSPVTVIDPRRVIVMLTSNKAELTVDLTNRSSCVRILKRPERYQFQTYEEGELLDHVRANQPRYLGAVFAVIRAWHAAGKPRTNETRHDFRGWAQVLDWIVQQCFGAAPLMDGHREIQARMSNPALNWLRDVGLAVVRQARVSRWLIATDLLDVIQIDGHVEVPGLREGAGVQDDAVHTAVLQQIGLRLRQAFCTQDVLTIDRLRIERQAYQDENRHERRRYRVTLAEGEGACGGRDATEPGEEGCP